VIGLSTLAIGVAPSLALIMVALVVLGFSIPPAQAAGTTLIQMSVPNDTLGRVNSAIGTTVTVANLLSMGAAGVAGDAIGIRNVFLFCGVMAVLAAIVGVFLIEEPAERGVARPRLPSRASATGSAETT
jgi:DHA3 family macrolide efflux protein-like MFS transporter